MVTVQTERQQVWQLFVLAAAESWRLSRLTSLLY